MARAKREIQLVISFVSSLRGKKNTSISLELQRFFWETRWLFVPDHRVRKKMKYWHRDPGLPFSNLILLLYKKLSPTLSSLRKGCVCSGFCQYSFAFSPYLVSINRVFCHRQKKKMLNFNSLCGINNVGRFIYSLQLMQACRRMGLKDGKWIKEEKVPCGR